MVSEGERRGKVNLDDHKKKVILKMLTSLYETYVNRPKSTACKKKANPTVWPVQV